MKRPRIRFSWLRRLRRLKRDVHRSAADRSDGSANGDPVVATVESIWLNVVTHLIAEKARLADRLRDHDDALRSKKWEDACAREWARRAEVAECSGNLALAREARAISSAHESAADRARAVAAELEIAIDELRAEFGELATKVEDLRAAREGILARRSSSSDVSTSRYRPETLGQLVHVWSSLAVVADLHTTGSKGASS